MEDSFFGVIKLTSIAKGIGGHIYNTHNQCFTVRILTPVLEGVRGYALIQFRISLPVFFWIDLVWISLFFYFGWLLSAAEFDSVIRCLEMFFLFDGV